jgi:hypothetical protein
MLSMFSLMPDQQLRILAMGRVLSHIVDRGGAVFRLRSPANVGSFAA